MKAIETFYNGHRFRSRLEARWAVVFDALGVKYEYEPEGFVLPDGTYYLPDFRVKCHGTRGNCNPEESFDLYIEVKGRMTEEDARKIRLFAEPSKNAETFYEAHRSAGEYIKDWPESLQNEFRELADYDNCQRNPILVVGNIPPAGGETDSLAVGAYDLMDGVDICPFNYDLIDDDCFGAYPAADRYGNFYLFGDDSNYINDEDANRVMLAYTVARCIQFEHGAKPEQYVKQFRDSIRKREQVDVYGKAT